MVTQTTGKCISVFLVIKDMIETIFMEGFKTLVDTLWIQCMYTVYY